MKFYHYICDGGQYGFLRFVEKYTHEQGFPVSGQFHRGQSIASSWQPAAMEVNTSGGPLSDFPMDTVPPKLSKRAWDVLRPLIGKAVEALPVATPFGTYFALNVLDVIDCLDYPRSEFTYYPASMGGEMHRIIKYHLKSSLIRDKPIFKIPEEMTKVIVSEEFKELVVGASLEGLDFSHVLYET